MSFIIKNGFLEKYIEEDETTEIIIPTEVTNICQYAFRDCKCLKKVTITQKVSIAYRAFQDCPSLETLIFAEKPSFETLKFSAPVPFSNCPRLRLTTEQIKQSSSISNAFATLKTSYSSEELAWLSLYQGNRDWVKRVESQISADNADEVLKEIINVIKKNKKVTKTVGNRAAAFALMYYMNVEQQDVLVLSDVLETRCKEAAETLKEDPRLADSSGDSKYRDQELFCMEMFTKLNGDKLFADYKITGFRWPQIEYSDGTVASAIVLKYLVVQYAKNRDGSVVRFYPDADRIAECLDKESLNNAMLQILEKAPVRAHRVLYYSICRYVKADQFVDVLKYNYSHSQEDAAFTDAAILNISPPAVSFLGRKREIMRYIEDPEILSISVGLLSKNQKKRLLDYALAENLTEKTAILLESMKKD